jgi:pyruvate,water dikinase
MLGFHGIRYSIKNPEILKAELNAMKRITQRGTTIGILMPQLILVEELKEVKKIIKEIGADKIKVGIMIETPAAVQIIKELCEEGISHISFGTNDLTQYILAIDRGNEKVQYLYNEMHPAVLYQMAFVIRVCKRYNVESSICGQAGSKKEMAKFLVEQGIDSISVNADKAAEIAKYVKEVEETMVKNTDKEPRKIKPKDQIKKAEIASGKEVNPNLEKDIKEIEKEKEEYEKEEKIKESNVF